MNVPRPVVAVAAVALVLTLVGALPQGDSHNLDARLRALETVLTPENGVKLMKMLPHMRVVEEANLDGSTSTTIAFVEVNVQIVNGLGATNGAPDAPLSVDPTVTRVNGLGNLIVGYNEGADAGLNRTGSHNIIVGTLHQYSSFGGLVVGSSNKISGVYSSISGGLNITASGDHSSVSGGHNNTAGGHFSSVSGGENNNAGGDHSTVSGGHNNTASGDFSSVSGGTMNMASGSWSAVSGGQRNMASGDHSSVSGGMNNTVTATGTQGTVSGGCSVTVNTACGHQ